MKLIKAIKHRISALLLKLVARVITKVANTKWYKDYQAELKNQEWKTLLDAAKSSFTEDELKTWGPVLETQVGHLRQQVVADGQGLRSFNPGMVVFAAVKAIKEIKLLRELVGIQPLQSPVGLTYHLQFKTEGAISGDDTPTRTLRLEVQKNPVEAKSRKLQAKFNVEAMTDLSAVYGISVEAELTSMLGSEMAGEVILEVLNDLHKLGQQNTIAVDRSDQEKPFVSNITSLVVINIMKAATRIADRTRRGAGNFIVVSPMMLSVLQASGRFTANTSANSQQSYALKFAGMLNDNIRVYVSMGDQFIDNILVGYKGMSGEIDTGYIHSPYIPLMPTGILIDPATFTPTVGLMTRYGKGMYAPSDRDTSPAAYYAVVDVSLVKDMLFSPVDETPTNIVQ